MHQITGNGVAAIMIPVDCPREPGPLSLTHKRFKSGQFCMGTIEDVFLMAPITAEARGGISESQVKLEASRRACDYREQECRWLAGAVLDLRPIHGYRYRSPPPTFKSPECRVPVFYSPQVRKNLVSGKG